MNKIITVIGALATGCIVSSGQTASGASIIDQILQSNPTLKAIQADNIAATDAERADNTLQGPEAEFEHVWSHDNERKWSVGITQSFDWPGLYSARSKAAQAAAQARGFVYISRLVDIRLEARKLLVELEFCNQRLEIVDNMIDDMKRLNQYLKSALDNGLVTILDYKKSGLELTTLTIERDNIEDKRKRVEGLLDDLAGHPLDWEDYNNNGSAASISQLLPLEHYIESATASDMSLQAAIANRRYAELSSTVAARSLAPSFAIGYRHEKEEGTHFNGFSVSVGLPSWGISRTMRAAKSAEVASQSAVDEARILVVSRVRSEYNSAVSLRDDIVALRQNGLDGSYISLLHDAFQGGEISVLDYLREQSYYRSTRLGILDLEEQYALTLTSLNRYDD